MIKEIEIINYKSFGTSDNVLKMNNKVTSIVGKNESGKSNLIDIVSKVDRNHVLRCEVEKDINKKNRREGKILINLVIDDIEEQSSEIKVQNNTFAYISGSISTQIQRDEELSRLCNKFLDIITQKEYGYDRNSEEFNIKYCFSIFEESSEFIVTKRKEIFDSLKLLIRNLALEEAEGLIVDLDRIDELLSKYYSLIPTIFRYKEKELKDSYYCDQAFFDNYLQQDEIFRLIWDVAYIDTNDLKDACGITTEDPGVIFEQKQRINKKLKINISDKFNDFYKQSVLEFFVDIDNKEIRFIFSTDEYNTIYSERSQGFKWFFCMFLTMQSQIDDPNNMVVLIDEPGVFLHVNAQKELLHWFYDYTENTGNQIIYSTHSPYMLPKDDMVSVKGIEKNDEGNSVIVNKIYSNNKGRVTSETFTAVTEILGMNIADNLGLDTSGINLVVEGISDYQYLIGMKRNLEIKQTINIIPSTGASTILNIVPLLIGWNLEFKVLLDGDNEGKAVGKKLLKYGDYTEGKIAYTTDFANSKELLTIEGMFDEKDRKKIEQGCGIKDKVLSSSYFLRNYCGVNEVIEEESKEGFNKLFSWILN